MDSASRTAQAEGAGQPCHGEKSPAESGGSDAQSCCHDETSPDVPNGVALAMPDTDSVRLAIEEFQPRSAGLILFQANPESSRPPGPALYLKISRLLN